MATESLARILRLALLAAAALLALAALGANPAAAAPPPIDFQASGGFAGTQLRMKIEASGATTIASSGGKTRQLRIPKAAATQLRTLLRRAHFADMKTYYGPAQAYDLPTISITYGSHTVRTESGSPPAPRRLWAIVMQLYGIMDEAEHPFLAQLTLTAEHPLILTVMPNRRAIVDRGSDRRTGRLKPRCFAAFRRALGDLRNRKLAPGLIPRTNINPPPSLELTRSFSSFHARLGSKRVRAFAKQARATARCLSGS